MSSTYDRQTFFEFVQNVTIVAPTLLSAFFMNVFDVKYKCQKMASNEWPHQF